MLFSNDLILSSFSKIVSFEFFSIKEFLFCSDKSSSSNTSIRSFKVLFK